MRWQPRPLIDWDILNFSSESAQWNSTKLYRKHDLNVLHKVDVSSGHSKNQNSRPASDFLTIFDFYYETTERKSTKINMMQDLNVFF